MTNQKKNYLKKYRLDTGLSLKETAHLLNIHPSNLLRYESGKRLPSPRILLTYHILFGASLENLLYPMKEHIKSDILERSATLLLQSKNKQNPKSVLILPYLQTLVKTLKFETNG